MKNVRIKWEELLAIVKANREKHLSAWAVSVEGWIKETAERLAEEALVFQDAVDNNYPLCVELSRFDSKPVDHLRDYDRLIKMIELTDETHIELTEVEFDQYVNDEWNWKREFNLSNSKYGAIA